MKAIFTIALVCYALAFRLRKQRCSNCHVLQESSSAVHVQSHTEDRRGGRPPWQSYYMWIQAVGAGSRRLPWEVAQVLQPYVHAAQLPIVSKERRFEVKDKVRDRLTNLLTLRHGRYTNASTIPDQVQSVLQKVQLFTSAWSGIKRHTPDLVDKSILKRYDVLAVPTYAERDASFKWLPKIAFEKQQRDHPGWFYVLHVAAINIGEECLSDFTVAEDFVEYTWNGEGKQLDEDRYIKDMRSIWSMILWAAASLDFGEGPDGLGVQHIVLFPFGMGAFHRALGFFDSKYDFGAFDWKFDMKYKNIENVRRLKSNLVESIYQVLANPYLLSRFKDLEQIHICLEFEGLSETSLTSQDGWDRINEKTLNHDAFVATAAIMYRTGHPWFSNVQEKMKFHIHKDAFELANELSNRDSKKTVLLNGANSKLLGNHWFTKGAIRAIDENMHRRSLSLAATSFILNKGIEVRGREPNELAERVKRHGGRVYEWQAPDLQSEYGEFARKL